MDSTVSASPTDSQTAPLAISIESLAYGALFLVVVAFRWINLDDPLLTNVEAEQAFAALRVLNPGLEDIGAIRSPVIFVGNVASLALGSTSGATARFFPMVTGVLLAFSPLLFKNYLGRVPTLFAVLVLAISPGAIAACRQISGVSATMLGVMVLLFAFDRYAVTRRNFWTATAGIMFGIVILSDFAALAALLCIVLATVFALFTNEQQEDDSQEFSTLRNEFSFVLFSISAVAGTVILGSVFFIAPDGLQALSDLITRFATGIIRANPDAANAGLTFATYEILLFVFGVVGQFLLVRSTDFKARFLVGWGIASLLMLVLYQGAQPEHSLFAIVPMALLTGIACKHILTMERKGPDWVGWTHMIGIVAVIGILLLFLLFHLRNPNVMTIPFDAAPEDAFISYSAFLFIDIIVLLLLIMTIFFSAGWFSPETALFSTGGAIFIVTLLASIGLAGNITFTDTTDPAEVIRANPSQVGLSILVETVEDVSQTSAGNSMDIPMTVEGTPDSALAWAMRDFRNITFVPQVDPSVSTPIVVTQDRVDPALGDSYLGQKFVISRMWTPRGLSTADFLRWWIYRIHPTASVEEVVILWVDENTYQLRDATR